MQPNLLRNLCFLPTKNTKYRTFYRTHFLLISITCLSRYISLYRPALPWCHIAVALLSVEGQRALVFHQKYLNLWSKDERRPHEFVLTWGEYLNDRIFIFGWTNPVRYISNICFCFRCAHPIGLHSLHEEIRDPEAVKQISSSLFLFTSILLKL